MLDTKKGDLRRTQLFSNSFGFTGDLCVITDDHLESGRNFNRIYPSELPLKKENISTSDASFPDISIIIENKKFKTQFYDKRDV